jgi:hypothetical protein
LSSAAVTEESTPPDMATNDARVLRPALRIEAV